MCNLIFMSFSVDKYFLKKCNDPAVSAYVREPPNIYENEEETEM